MSDSIRVRVALDAYDFSRPSEKQTAVHVQIPEVARVTYMLPAERFAGLKDREWPEVLDIAHEHYERGWVVTDSASTAARAAIVAWLRDDTNRDEMQAAWELDQARRHPVAQKLLAEVERLRAQVAELEAELRIGAPWKCPTCSKENRRNVCVVCETDRPDPAEDSADRLTALLAPTQALRAEWCTGCNTDHDPAECGYRPEAGGASC